MTDDPGRDAIADGDARSSSSGDPAAPQTAPTPSASQRRSTLAATSWLVAAQVAPLAANIALTPFVIRQLGETEYGLWLVTSGIAAFVGQFDGGIYRTALRWFALEADTGAPARGAVVMTSHLLTIALCTATVLPIILFPRPLADFFRAPADVADQVASLLRVLAVVVVIGLLRSVYAAVLHSRMQFRKTAVATIAGYASYAVTMVLTLSNGMRLDGVAIAYMAQTAVVTILIVAWGLPLVEFRRPWLMGWPDTRVFCRTAWRVQVAGVLTALNQQTALLLVGRLRPQDVASFGPGSTFAQNFRSLPLNAVGPIQSRLASTVGAQGAAGARASGRQLQTLWVVGIAGVVATAAPAAYFGVNAWLPLGGDLAGLTACALMVSHGLSLLPQVCYQWSLAVGRPEVEVRTTALSFVLLVGGSLVLVPEVGAIGIVVASIAGNAVALSYCSVALRRLDVSLPNPVRDVPWAGVTAAAALVVGIELAALETASALGLRPDGPLGLVAAGLLAMPVLAGYALRQFGWDQIRARLGGLRSSRRAAR